jgi:16S rRNA U516 pseudouridylate synthase RsuA-like enzyme
VLGIHRFTMGALMLDAGLEPGQSRALTPTELDGLATVT